MNDQTPVSEREAKLEGIGCRRKRVEDVRFVQGEAITSMTSSCRACCMAILSAAHSPMRGSRRSGKTPRSPCPALRRF